MKLFWTIVLAFLVAACTPMEWVRPDAPPEQAQADSQQCQMAAWQEARWRALEYRSMWGPAFYYDRFGRAVPAPLAFNPFADPYMEEQRLANFCMRAKGYELLPTR
jgi:hypothetical protein